MGSYIICGIIGAAALVVCAITSHDKGVDEGMACGVSIAVDHALKDVAMGNIRLVNDYVEFSEDSCLVPVKPGRGRIERIPVEDILEGSFEGSSWEDAL